MAEKRAIRILVMSKITLKTGKNQLGHSVQKTPIELNCIEKAASSPTKTYHFKELLCDIFF